MQNHQKIKQLKSLSILMDSQFTGPFGFKFGLDGLLGLVPVLGDLITSMISFYIIFQAAMLGCSPSVILTMGFNVVLENTMDMLPIVGNVFDFIWRSNNKNIILLEKHLINPRVATVKARLTLGLVAFFLLVILIASTATLIYLIKFLTSLL